MMAISIGNQRATLIAHEQQSFLHMAELLAKNIAGGLHWQKADAVETAFMDFAIAEDLSKPAGTLDHKVDGFLAGIRAA